MQEHPYADMMRVSRYHSKKKLSELQHLSIGVSLLEDNWFEQLSSAYSQLWKDGWLKDRLLISQRLRDARIRFLQMQKPVESYSEDQLIYMLADSKLLIWPGEFTSEPVLENSLVSEQNAQSIHHKLAKAVRSLLGHPTPIQKADIMKVLRNEYSEIELPEGSVIPSDHCSNYKNDSDTKCSICGAKANAIFEKVGEKGSHFLYQVRPEGVLKEFRVGSEYNRSDVYDILALPENKRGGDWLNGYHFHSEDNAWFIFANVGSAGRTGHDYDNYWDGDVLVWRGKTSSRLSHDSIQSLLNPEVAVHIFTRNQDRSPFTYQGLAAVEAAEDLQPVLIRWHFKQLGATQNPVTVLQKPILVSDLPGQYDIAIIDEGLNELTAVGDLTPQRKAQLTERIVRDTKVSRQIKALYQHTCQVCGIQLLTHQGSYAEGAHIVPLAEDGPDTTDNVLCLCPNHHILFDAGGFTLEDDGQIVWIAFRGTEDCLHIHPKHTLAPEHLWYHRTKWMDGTQFTRPSIKD